MLSHKIYRIGMIAGFGLIAFVLTRKLLVPFRFNTTMPSYTSRITAHQPAACSPFYQGVKRALDLIVAVTALLVLWPLFALIALTVRITSPGAIFYGATRVGQNGQVFRLYKFRSMVADADKRGPGITAAGDSRVTPVGRFLRRTKLDELPQLINVLYGEMSLVGPRPEDPRYVALYSPEQREVLRVRPGITSPASVYYRNEETLLTGTDWEQQYVDKIMPAKLAIDLDYVRRVSLWGDINVLWRTFMALWNQS